MKRKLLTIAAAVAAVLSFATPAQAAGPIGDVVVDPGPASRPYQDYAMAAASVGAVTMAASTITLSCTSASASGKLHSRAVSTSPFPKYLTFDTFNLVGCTGPFGIPMTFTQNCDITVHADPPSQTVNAGLTDTNVTGFLDMGTSGAPCLSATGLCAFDIYGQTQANFNETVDPNNNTQDLTISGTGLRTDNANCFGLITNSMPIGLSVQFDIDITEAGMDGPINFRPSPPIADVVVDPGPASRPYQDYTVAAASVGAVTITVSSLTFGCTSASASGELHSRAVSTSPFPKYLTFDTFNLVGCTGPFGIPMTFTQNCDITVHADPPSQSVNAGLTDTNVTGFLDMGTTGSPCLSATGLCAFDIDGQTQANFNETVDPNNNTQDLTISGTGLKTGNTNCFGLFTNSAPIGLSVQFDVDITEPGMDGPINFRP